MKLDPPSTGFPNPGPVDGPPCPALSLILSYLNGQHYSNYIKMGTSFED